MKYFWQSVYFIHRNANAILWAVAAVAATATLILSIFIFFRMADTVHDIKANQDANEAKIEADHERIQREQNRLFDCVLTHFADGKVPTKKQVKLCIPNKTDMGNNTSTPSSSDAQSMDNHTPDAVSSPKSKTKKPKSRPDNSPTPRNEQTCTKPVNITAIDICL